MEEYTIKEASELTGISATTIRRYIKSGKVTASLRKGRYGPEYRITRESLNSAGFDKNSLMPARKNGNNNGFSTEAMSALLKDFIPASLYQELAMKHEQLLVQYGMVRAGGQRLLEYKADNEMKEQMLKEKHDQFEATINKCREEIEFLKKHLRVAELEIGEKNAAIRELKEKISVLELLSRNAVTNETIEKQFMEIYSKQQEIKRISDTAKDPEGRLREETFQKRKEHDH